MSNLVRDGRSFLTQVIRNGIGTGVIFYILHIQISIREYRIDHDSCDSVTSLYVCLHRKKTYIVCWYSGSLVLYIRCLKYVFYNFVSSCFLKMSNFIEFIKKRILWEIFNQLNSHVGRFCSSIFILLYLQGSGRISLCPLGLPEIETPI